MLIPSVRKIHNHHSSKVISHIYSFKINSLITCESTLERDWLLHLEANPDVQRIVSQPIQFRVYHENKWRRYTPDFLVEWSPKLGELPTIYEVKPYEIASTADWDSYFKSIRELLLGLGYRFEVVTERQIRTEPTLGNLKMLRLYASEFISKQERQEISLAVGNVSACSIHHLVELLGRSALAGIYRMLWDGELRYERSCKLSMATNLWVPEGGVR
ncbi:TnsA endonuclease N-terminal domain-containing protein [Deefgea sp. CFH1-16]|uniref:TnsA endonuclease N-terminal domain-containing protein n=1 Tax=Deefgea sp. CFH1-16 TaxID=2675457 RepID=UPI0019402DD5|nr:TnsA endonuclease N-terminal domain-containing protein [Deefgea sp. CFH1-16]